MHKPQRPHKRQRGVGRQPADSDTDSHVCALLGMQIHMSDTTRLYPNIFQTRIQRYEQSTVNAMTLAGPVDTGDAAERTVMIVPAAVAFMSVVRTTPRAGHTDTYLQYEGCATSDTPRLHMAGIVLQAMRLPAECVLHGILYYDKTGTLVLGLFDMRSCDGVALHEAPPLERHLHMRKTVEEQDLKMQDRRLFIRHLWVGQERACLRSMQNPQNIPNMSFAVKCIGVLPSNICTDVFQRMLIPLNIPASNV